MLSLDPRLFDKDWLIQKYVTEQFSMNRIAQILDVTVATVSKRLKALDIPLRSGGESKTITSKQVGPKNKFLADKEWLYQKYVVEQLALRDVAAAAGRGSRRGVVGALEYHGIPQRDLKEARNNRSAKGPELRATDNPLANDLDHIKALYDSGKSIETICNELGASHDAIRHRFKVAQIETRTPWEANIGKTRSDETKAKMSNTASQQIVDGTRSSYCQGNKVMCLTPHDGFIKTRSAWEKSYAEYLNANNIDYYYEPTAFRLSSGKSYVADFYLPAMDEYIEIKGFLSDSQAEKYDLFKKEYPTIKWKILYGDDLKMLGIDVRKKYKDVYMLCGVAGAGKSWVANQLLDSFHYVSFDGISKSQHVDVMRQYNGEKPILYDPNIKVSTFIKRHSHEFNIIPIFILETEEVVKSRIALRGGTWTPHIPKRIAVMHARNAKYGVFSGTAQEVLNYLKSLDTVIPIPEEDLTWVLS